MAQLHCHACDFSQDDFWSSDGWNIMTSDETAWLPPGYYIDVHAMNTSDTAWNFCVTVEVFREKTA